MIEIFGDSLLYVNLDECTACTACYQPDVCPVGAIYSDERVPDANKRRYAPDLLEELQRRHCELGPDRREDLVDRVRHPLDAGHERTAPDRERLDEAVARVLTLKAQTILLALLAGWISLSYVNALIPDIAEYVYGHYWKAMLIAVLTTVARTVNAQSSQSHAPTSAVVRSLKT